jgi:hypothetical protein
MTSANNMRTLQAQNMDEISGILDYVHDRRYKIENIAYDQAARTLRIPVEVKVSQSRSILGLRYKGKGDGLAILTIKNVKDWRIAEDRSQIGYGDINRILVQPGIVFIEGSLPVNIEVQVDGHEVELSAPDDIVMA